MTTPVRITAVSYLNTLPFIYGIEQRVALSSAATAGAERGVRSSVRSAGADGGGLADGEGIALSLKVPALCAADAIAGRTDIALVPVAAVPLIPGFSLTDSFSAAADGGSPAAFTPQIVTDFCIGAEGAVETVVLLSDTPLEALRRVYLDSHSRTSVQLVRVLARERWGIDPQWVDAAECVSDFAAGKRRLRFGEAMVAIGDKVFSLKAGGRYAYCYDLAEEWRRLTGGLPFVFAAWVACSRAGLDFAPTLNGALAFGVNHIADSITGTTDRSRNFDFLSAYDYLTRSIRFDLDDRKRLAMRLFWEKIISPG